MEEIVSIYTVLVGVILFLDPEWSGSTQMNDPNGRENQKERKKEKEEKNIARTKTTKYCARTVPFFNALSN